MASSSFNAPIEKRESSLQKLMAGLAAAAAENIQQNANSAFGSSVPPLTPRQHHGDQQPPLTIQKQYSNSKIQAAVQSAKRRSLAGRSSAHNSSSTGIDSVGHSRTPPKNVAQQYTYNFDCLMDDNDGRNLLAKYLEEIQCGEVLRFAAAVEHLHALKSAFHRTEEAKKIVKLFIEPESDMELNIAAGLKRDCLSRIRREQSTEHGVEPSVFDEVMQHLINSIKQDTFPRFVESKHFQEFVYKKLVEGDTQILRRLGAKRRQSLRLSVSGNGQDKGGLEYKRPSYGDFATLQNAIAKYDSLCSSMQINVESADEAHAATDADALSSTLSTFASRQLSARDDDTLTCVSAVPAPGATGAEGSEERGNNATCSRSDKEELAAVITDRGQDDGKDDGEESEEEEDLDFDSESVNSIPVQKPVAKIGTVIKWLRLPVSTSRSHLLQQDHLDRLEHFSNLEYEPYLWDLVYNKHSIQLFVSKDMYSLNDKNLRYVRTMSCVPFPFEQVMRALTSHRIRQSIDENLLSVTPIDFISVLEEAKGDVDAYQKRVRFSTSVVHQRMRYPMHLQRDVITSETLVYDKARERYYFIQNSCDPGRIPSDANPNALDALHNWSRAHKMELSGGWVIERLSPGITRYQSIYMYNFHSILPGQVLRKIVKSHSKHLHIKLQQALAVQAKPTYVPFLQLPGTPDLCPLVRAMDENSLSNDLVTKHKSLRRSMRLGNANAG